MSDAGVLTPLVEEVLLLVLLEELRGPSLVQEQRVNPLDVIHTHLCTLTAAGQSLCIIIVSHNRWLKQVYVSSKQGFVELVC